jgi:hypothetical protein
MSKDCERLNTYVDGNNEPNIVTFICGNKGSVITSLVSWRVPLVNLISSDRILAPIDGRVVTFAIPHTSRAADT